MAKVYITRRVYFNSAHKLWVEDWSAEKNKEVFGKCANENWHGHNFSLFVTVSGTPDTTTGMLVDLKDLSALLKEKIVEKVDHRNLNLDVSFMKGIMPTIENFAIAVWQEIEEPVSQLGGKLHSVRIHETENNFVEYFGE